MSLLDGQAVRRRRLELGISERGLARKLGVTAGVVKALESGRNHQSLRLGSVNALAAELGMTVEALLATHTAPVTSPGDVSDLAAKVITALVMSGGYSHVEALAEMASVTLPEIGGALEEIEEAGQRLGLRAVRTAGGTVRLTPTRADAGDLADRLAEAELSQRGLSHSQIRVLWEVAAGRADTEWQRRGGEGRRLAVAFLERSRLVRHEEGCISLTPAARASLRQSADAN